MAEQQQTNSKGIGELFIEFGTKGLPSLLKGLNTVSASFLLTKNAAEQLTKPIKEVFKSAGNEAVGIGKMSALLGASVKDVQKITNYFKGKNVDPSSALSGIAKLQSAIYDIQNGRGGLDKNMQRGLDLLGINIWNYNQELESTLQLVEDIQTATKNFHPVDRQAHLRDIGIPEFGYLFERGEFNKSDVLTLSDKDIEKLQDAADATVELDTTTKKFIDKLTSKVSPLPTQLNKDAAALLNGTKAPEDAPYATGVAVKKVLEETHPYLSFFIRPFVGAHFWGAANLAKQQRSLGNTSGKLSVPVAGGGQIDFSNNPFNFKPINPEAGQPTGFASPIVPPDMQNGHIPPNLSTSNNSVTYNNTFNITGSNAEEIGQEVKNQLDIQSLEFNQFQLENLPRR